MIVAFDRVVFGGNFVSRITLLGGEGALNVADLVEPRSPSYAPLARDRAIEATLRGETVRVLSPDHFVLFKVLSTRERDLEDAATVLGSASADFDLGLIESEAAHLASEIADHDVLGRLRRVLPLRPNR